MGAKLYKTNAGLFAHKHFSGVIAKIAESDTGISIQEWCIPTELGVAMRPSTDDAGGQAPSTISPIKDLF